MPGKDLVVVTNSTAGGDPYRLAQVVLALFGIGELPPDEVLPPSL